MKWVLCWMTGKGSGPESRSTSYSFTHTSRSHRFLEWPRIIQHTWRVCVLTCARGHNRYATKVCKPTSAKGTYSVKHGFAADRVDRRKAMIAPVATEPYSSSIIQPGTTHGRPTVRKCQT
jgi:hypothetical protein